MKYHILFNLHLSAAEEEDLWELFSSCGTIKSIRIVRDPITAVSKGIAFVNFEVCCDS